jgi:hypothetical protein
VVLAGRPRTRQRGVQRGRATQPLLRQTLLATEDAPEADGERHQEHRDDDFADNAARRVSHDQVRHSESEEEQRAKQAET